MPQNGNNVTQGNVNGNNVTQGNANRNNDTQGSASGQYGVTELGPGATSTLHLSGKNSVLLQTATATVSNSLRNALELPSLLSENLVIKTFGGDSDQPKRCDVVVM